MSVLEGILVTLGGAWGHPAMHSATAVRHRWRPAPAPAPCPGSASRAVVHGQFASPGVVSLILFDPPGTSTVPTYLSFLPPRVAKSVIGTGPRRFRAFRRLPRSAALPPHWADSPREGIPATSRAARTSNSTTANCIVRKVAIAGGPIGLERSGAIERHSALQRGPTA
jgi:hypothetical protein